MSNKHFDRARVGIGIAGALLLASCAGAQQAAGSDKAGGDAEPVVLTMADATAGLYSNSAVQYFVDQVAELSDGSVRIDVHSQWGDFAPDVEQQIVGDVAAGEADVAWVWTHAFDTLDINAFRALSAPMLIDSYPLQQVVIASDISGEMLPELDAVGVTGLAVLADGLVKPIAVDHPLLAPADYEGITFTSRRSTTYADAILALGANAEVAIADARTAGLTSGEIQGYERSLHLYAIGQPHLSPYVTANLNLWADPAALIANPDTLAELSDTQRDWVMQAAASASEQSTDLVNHDADVLVELCELGARFANASDADLTAMREAFEPVYATLEQDAQTADFIARIEELKAATDPGPALDVPADCTGVSPLAVPAAAAGDDQASGDQSVLNGTYRWTLGPGNIFTVILDDGVWTMRHEEGDGTSTVDCDSADCTYTVSGRTVTFDWGGAKLVFTFTADENDSLLLEPRGDLNAGDVFVWTSKPWERIDGGAAAAPAVTALDGTYRWTLTADDAVAHGNPNDQTPEGLATFPQVWTVTLDHGRWTMGGQNDSEEWVACDSADCLYTVDGNRIVFDGEPGGYVSEFTFTSDEDGNLQLQPVSADAGAVFVMTTKPLERIN